MSFSQSLFDDIDETKFLSLLLQSNSPTKTYHRRYLRAVGGGGYYGIIKS